MKLLRKREITFLFILVLFYVITLTGCGNKAEKNEEKTVNQEQIKDDMEDTPGEEEEGDGLENETEDSEQEKVYTYNTLEVKGLRITEQSLKGIKLEWAELPNTEYYEIMRSTEEGELSIVHDSTDSNDAYYYDEEILPGVTYYYCVRGISSLEETGLVSKESSVVSTSITLSTPNIEVKEAKEGVTITVSQIDIGQGYGIYMATEEKGKYKNIKTQDDLQVNSFTYKSLESGKTYYFKAKTFYKNGEETDWSKYSNVISYTVKSSLEAAEITKDNLDIIKSTEPLFLEFCSYLINWDPNRELGYKHYEVTHVSFVPGSDISPFIFLVRSKRIGSKDKGIDKIEAFSVYHDGLPNVFTYYEGGAYSLFESYDPVIKMYKDNQGNQFMLGHFKFDCSGASGQVGTLYDGYYKLGNLEYAEVPDYEIGADYELNYHFILNSHGEGGTTAEVDNRYKKTRESYFKNIKVLDYKETKVAYNMEASFEERYKALEKAYKANYKYLDK